MKGSNMRSTIQLLGILVSLCCVLPNTYADLPDIVPMGAKGKSTLELHLIPSPGFARYKRCEYIKGAIRPHSRIISSVIARSWEPDIPADLTQLTLEWSCADEAKGDREYLVSCQEQLYQVYSGYSQSQSEIREGPYYGWMDNYAGEPPKKRDFDDPDPAAPNDLTEYVLAKLCGGK